MTGLEQMHQIRFETNQEMQIAIDIVNDSLSKINLKNIEQLDTSPWTYATDETRTSKINDHRPYEYQHDLERLTAELT